ncbi:YdeI/OmpD-associated family protein [soil metagenome]
MADEKTIEQFDGPEAFRAWLVEHHERPHGMWLKIAKKNSGVVTVTYDEALGVALQFGWIDGQKRSFDDTFFLQAFTQRRPQSPWSKRNRDRVEAMIEAGTMEPSGLAEVERAKANGRWDKAYDGQSNAEPPADFLAALAKNPAAAAFYATLNGTNRFAVYFRINEAKKPETRARRIEKFVEMFANGEKFY